MNFARISASVRLFVLGLALVGGTASVVRAEDPVVRSQSQSQGQTYQVSGVDPQQGAYTGQVTITPRADGAVEVQRDVRFESGQRQQQAGVGSQRGQEIRAQLRPVTEGLSGQLGSAGQEEAPVQARITAQVDAQAGTIEARVQSAQGGVSREQGEVRAQTSPSTGQTSPSTGQTSPSQDLPSLGDALPVQAEPSTGQTSPTTGQTSPSTGQTSPSIDLPSLGEPAPQTSPSTGQTSPSVGQTTPAQTLPSTGQTSPSTGQTSPSQGGVSNQAGPITQNNQSGPITQNNQSGPITQAPSALPPR